MYVSLNVKTEYSLLSSLIRINDLVSVALENKVNVLAISDNNMYGVMDFYLKCKKNHIKPIIGLDIPYKESNIFGAIIQLALLFIVRFGYRFILLQRKNAQKNFLL